MTKEELKALHSQSSKHILDIKNSECCGCFYCLKVFNPEKTKITEWTDKGQTALCPRCGIDSILPGVTSEDILSKMNAHYFGIFDGNGKRIR